MSRPPSLLKGAIVLALLACATLGATLVWQQYCQQRIIAAEQTLKARALLTVLPADSYDNQPLEAVLQLKEPALATSTLVTGYLATLGGKPHAVVLQSRTQGYDGPLDLLIGIDSNGRLLGVKVLQHNETPGLGARIAEPSNPLMQGFTGLGRTTTPDAAWALRKDQGQFDQIAGATVTSRAVVNAVHEALRYFDEHAGTFAGVKTDD
ncbi:RnfABCDGE type electron transport complex subunit G [Pseudomonas akapageensis]|uniref:RnfABCDGE type electron transport complex subunit G n=1 Tax=Pseudomonas akapageensis TaxID=2609961 RepID=UPI00140B5F24|nr:RnfABCDGE type electron transport complex subunit G [Pseudomonas akapageensis]